MAVEKEIHKLSGFFDTGWKIISALVMVIAFIVQVALAWYKIGDNATDIYNLEKKMDAGFINEADKRTTRISATDAKFDKVDAKQDKLFQQIDDLQKEVYYLKGLLATKK